MKYIVGFLFGLIIAVLTYLFLLETFVIDLLKPYFGGEAVFVVGLFCGPIVAIGAGIVGFIITVWQLGKSEPKKEDESLDTRQKYYRK